MILERTKNAKKNIFWGLINKTVKIVVPFIIRTIIIYKLGEEYIGLNSLFTSILSTLSLAELGFDTAIVAIMYRYVADEDNDIINALVNFIRKAYLWVGSIILIAGCCCIPFLKLMINDYESLPNDINLYVIYLLFLINTVITYFFGGYRNSIFEAYQRQDILSNLNTGVTLLFSLFQIYALAVSHNYYVYLVLIILSNIVLNLLVYYVSIRRFRNVKPVFKLLRMSCL
jgi:O-antigen/teichoic acid export membrane protein